MPLTFAYGSNMDRAAMRARCPGAHALGPALLRSHRFVIMPEGYANVVPDPADAVHGLLWDASEADMRALDAYEEVGDGLYARVELPVERRGAERAPAIVYVGRGEGGRPRPGYLEGVIAALRENAAPSVYVARVEAFAAR